MARPKGELTRCGGRWTEARYRSFITSLLRSGTKRWAPIQDCLSKARRRRGFYECAECHELVPATITEGRKRVKNVVVDHIKPIVNPETGFTSWDDWIEGAYCELDNLQALCLACHKIKCNEERAYAAECRRNRK